mmetsp:Transcript_10720/g.36399  ORF Transcript_10720/g.36399 Transcript_10720/m.36399 type:complete len:241 (+) Transcript_10720:237-959(+)
MCSDTVKHACAHTNGFSLFMKSKLFFFPKPGVAGPPRPALAGNVNGMAVCGKMTRRVQRAGRCGGRRMGRGGQRRTSRHAWQPAPATSATASSSAAGGLPGRRATGCGPQTRAVPPRLTRGHGAHPTGGARRGPRPRAPCAAPQRRSPRGWRTRGGWPPRSSPPRTAGPRGLPRPPRGRPPGGARAWAAAGRGGAPPGTGGHRGTSPCAGHRPRPRCRRAARATTSPPGSRRGRPRSCPG